MSLNVDQRHFLRVSQNNLCRMDKELSCKSHKLKIGSSNLSPVTKNGNKLEYMRGKEINDQNIM